MPKRRNRDYDKEYREYHGTPEQRKRRSNRTLARYYAKKRGEVKKGDGKEIDHKDFNPNNNKRSNLRVLSRRANRRRQPKRKG